MIRILTDYEAWSYFDNINDGNVDKLDEIDVFNNQRTTSYAVGDEYCGGKIEDIYYHDTSDCIWFVVRTDDGGYFEVGIDGIRKYNN